MSVITHSVTPDLVKVNNTYSPQDQLDFQLNFVGRKHLMGTVRFQGQIQVALPVGVENPSLDSVVFDCMVGAHGVIDTITTTVQNLGQVESIQGYSRYHKMVMSATQSRNDTMNSYNSCEMKAPSDIYTNMMINGIKSKIPRGETDDTDYNVNPDFSLKPSFCLNRTTAVDSDDNSVAYTKSGTVRVSIILARAIDYLFGADVTNLSDYKVINPRMTFQSIPDDGKQAKLQMRVEYNLKASINSADSVISTRVPVVADGVSVSFIPVSHESSGEYNNLALETLPALTETVFLWNNASNVMVTYTIRDLVEVTDKYLESLKTAGHSNVSLQMLKANKSFGIGLNFQTFVNLANQSFNIQMKCGVDNSNPFTAHLYFHGLIEL